jgi:hypothetical protein
MARGDVGHALHANAVGALLFTLTVLAVPGGAAAALLGVSFRNACASPQLPRLALALATLAFVHWFARVTWLLAG